MAAKVGRPRPTDCGLCRCLSVCLSAQQTINSAPSQPAILEGLVHGRRLQNGFVSSAFRNCVLEGAFSHPIIVTIVAIRLFLSLLFTPFCACSLVRADHFSLAAEGERKGSSGYSEGRRVNSIR